MAIFFIIVFFIISEYLVSVAKLQQSGYNPYPFATPIMCLITHAALLVSSIWYCGWLWGIVLFVCNFFGIIDMTIGWIIGTIPAVLYSPEKYTRHIQNEVNCLPLIWIVSLAGCILSFIFVPYKSLYIYFSNHINVLIVIAVLASIGFIVRILIGNRIKQKTRR